MSISRLAYFLASISSSFALSHLSMYSTAFIYSINYISIGYSGNATLNCTNGGYRMLTTSDNPDQSSYVCQCPPGFTGHHCEEDISYCSSIVCHNGGSCVEGYGLNVTCVCKVGFSGEFCELVAEKCTPNLCQNGGTCYNRSITGVVCDCRVGFEGHYCQTQLCSPETCRNGGTCSVCHFLKITSYLTDWCGWYRWIM